MPALQTHESIPRCPSGLDWTEDYDDIGLGVQAARHQQELIGSSGTSPPALTADAYQRSTHHDQAIPDQYIPQDAFAVRTTDPSLPEYLSPQTDYAPSESYLYPDAGQTAPDYTLPSPVSLSDHRPGPFTPSGIFDQRITPTGQNPEANHRKRKRLEPGKRESVKRMREQGACLRCRSYRTECDRGDPCNKCKIVQTQHIYKEPCVRVSIQELMPFRAGNSRTEQSRSKFPEYKCSSENQEMKRIFIQHPWQDLVSGYDIPLLQVRCRLFVPGQNDCLSGTYEAPDGRKMTIDFPPYACVKADKDKMGMAMSQYLDDSQSIAERAMDTDHTDDLILLPLKEARRYARKLPKNPSEGQSMVEPALKILAAGYISEIQPTIVGNETLDIAPVDDKRFKQHNQRLIPIAMDYQIDYLYIEYMHQNLKPILSRLGRLVSKGKADELKESWFEIFLTSFVLLVSLEMVFDKQMSFVKKYQGVNANIFATASQVKAVMIEEWQQSAKNLIYVFRCLARGMVPFGLQWSEEMQKRAKLDDEGLAFVRQVSRIVDQRRESLAQNSLNLDLTRMASDDELVALSKMSLNNNEVTPLLWIARLFVQEE
ncbi:uncharacterized protein BDV14DRAFT_194844 [Aspergillus stella-maris]|uniref:uncharacterized protein n=1 Tax=Aspergillus stella-maris TaxID=1810926 RepID=UPI003CCCC4AD